MPGTPDDEDGSRPADVDDAALPPDVVLRIREVATEEEAAAIAAAVGAYLADERAAAAATASEDPLGGRRWALAARLEQLSGRPGRVPRGVPTAPWSVAGRAPRF